jgi:hypothetical protein
MFFVNDKKVVVSLCVFRAPLHTNNCCSIFGNLFFAGIPFSVMAILFLGSYSVIQISLDKPAAMATRPGATQLKHGLHIFYQKKELQSRFIWMVEKSTQWYVQK